MIPVDLLFQMDALTGVYSVRYEYILFYALLGAIFSVIVYQIVRRAISGKIENRIPKNTLPDRTDPLFIEKLTQYLRREIGGFPLPEAHTAREMRLHSLKSILEDIEHREYAGLGFSEVYIDDILYKIHSGQ